MKELDWSYNKMKENTSDYGVNPNYCRGCRKKTISKDESISFNCPKCGGIK